VPESGEVYQTTTDGNGKYSYSVPDGDYLVVADDPSGGAYLEPVNGDGSVTVPPNAKVNFQQAS
jgi:hypothetical protein